MPFVGGPNTRITHPSRHIGKMEKSAYLRDSLTDRQEIWQGNAVRIS